ncbi:MAG: DUF6331 family protein [Fulvivirga sp.]
MEFSKDISIAKDKWIKWIEFDAESINSKDIGYLIEPTIKFWKQLEIECLAECCGIDAFSFWAENIQKANKKANISNLENLINQIIEKVAAIKEDVVVSSQLNQLINRKVFLELLEHIKKNIKSSAIPDLQS